MKRFHLLVVVAFIAACGSKPVVDDKPVAAEAKNVGDEISPVESASRATSSRTYGEGYGIDYPAGWELKPKFMGTDSMAVSPLEKNDQIRENINVVFESTSVTMTPFEYYNANLPTMQAQLVKFTALSNQAITLLSGTPAHELIYTHDYNGITFQVRAVFLANGVKGYVITCTAVPASFANYAGTFDTVINSFLFE